MPELATQGAMINYAEEGAGDPLVLVHGSWDERETWRQVVPLLIDEFRVITFDRRGHGRSRGAGPLDADVDDLAALIEHVGPPVNVAASSLGAVIALRLATRRPEFFLTLAVHEPPLFDLLGDHPLRRVVEQRMAGAIELLEAGRAEEGARAFVEGVASFPGAWDLFLPEERARLVCMAHTFVEEHQDPTTYGLDVGALTVLRAPVLLTGGHNSPPYFGEVLSVLEHALPGAERQQLRGAHLPHRTHPKRYAAMLRDFAGRSTSQH